MLLSALESVDQLSYRDKMTNRATVIGCALGIVAFVSLVVGLSFRVIAGRHTRRAYTQIWRQSHVLTCVYLRFIHNWKIYTKYFVVMKQFQTFL